MDLVEIAKVGLLFTCLIGLAPLMSWLEREQSALMHGRARWARTRPAGGRPLARWRPLANALKLLTKEDVAAAGAHRWLRALAPVLAAVSVLLAFAVIPWGGRYELGGRVFSLVVADLDYGALYLLALAAVSAYGAILGGWSSGNPWGALGALRASAQLLSYSVALGASLVGVFMVFGSLRLTEIGLAQQDSFRLLGFVEHLGWAASGSAWVDFVRVPSWGIALQPLGFVLFLAAALTWSGRAPFDAPEAASEVAGGYMLQYGGAKLALFRLAELMQPVVIAGWMTAMFLGGWSLPWLADAQLIGGLAPRIGATGANLVAMGVHVTAFLTKLAALLVALTLIRRTLPRFRSDQVLALGWKVLLPLALANVVATAVVSLIVEAIA